MNRGSRFEGGTITLNSTNGAYYAGQVVSGIFQFTINTPLTFQAINVRFLGEAVVSWVETETREYHGHSQRHDVEYKGREEYFNFIQCVAGGNPAPTTLNPGTYTFNFQYQTPYVVPSSYQGNKGKIWYRAIAYIEYPGMHLVPSEHVIRIFDVIAPLDLNNENDAKTPIEMEFEEIYSCCVCQSDPLTISIRSPSSGFCPGQVISLDVKADNRSSYEVQKMIFTLRKVEEVRSQQPVAEYKLPDKVLTTVVKKAIPASCKRNFTVEIKVPDMIAPNTDNCAIISAGYYIKVQIEVSGCNDGSEDGADILLGLIPLTSTLKEPYVHPMADRLPQTEIPKQNAVYPSNTPYSTPTNQNVTQTSPYPGPIGFITTPMGNNEGFTSIPPSAPSAPPPY